MIRFVVAYIKRMNPTKIIAAPRKRDSRVTYSHSRWRLQSEQWLRMYPFCVLCLCYGQLNHGSMNDTLATQRTLVVDHIRPHRNDETLFWTQSNWETLCRTCHDSFKSHVDRSGKDWWHELRNIMRDKQSKEFIEQHREWIPQHVMEALCA